jgi:alpha-D-ribose 1-methylphosphonate 5-phosphate C-P lyase
MDDVSFNDQILVQELGGTHQVCLDTTYCRGRHKHNIDFLVRNPRVDIGLTQQV